MAKLKVYRTPAGFHDAYVAATSQKAALAAWGSDANLFARGIAEEVTDPALMAAPLDRPGEVIRVARTMDDADEPPPRRSTRAPSKASAPETPAARAKGRPQPKAAPKPKPKPEPKPKPKPKPKRTRLDQADAALAAAEARHKAEREALRREEQALAAKRRALDKAQAAERTRLDRRRIDAREAYEAALDQWREP
jgi:outer membrane biosynthesis protein TonB